MVENVIEIKGRIMITANASVKNIIYVKKTISEILLPCTCRNDKYLGSIIDDSVIRYDENLDTVETKTVTTNFNKKNAICKTKNFYILLAFSLITNVLLIAVSIYCFLIKC